MKKPRREMCDETAIYLNGDSVATSFSHNVRNRVSGLACVISEQNVLELSPQRAPSHGELHLEDPLAWSSESCGGEGHASGYHSQPQQIDADGTEVPVRFSHRK